MASELIKAAHAGDADRLGALLRDGADVNAADSDQRTALYWAVQQQHVASSKLLLAAGATPNVQCVLAFTPLQLACIQGNLELVSALLAADADVTVPGKMGFTALHEAIQRGQREAAAMLIDHGAPIDARTRVQSTGVISGARRTGALAAAHD
eukprot:m.156184 g.156184  ORF g.156184 m.156184 type:complete len:153 (+) comp10214_c0_seq2:131-589(+)